MTKTLTLRVSEGTYQTLAEAAAAEGRSIANLIETAAVEHLRERQFVDDAEIAEIAANEKLVARLGEGRSTHAHGGAGSLSDYRIFETEQFAKDLRAIARGGQARVGRKLREVVYPELRERPHFGPNIKKLRGWHPECWRYRIGSWRFFFEIDEAEHIVFMIAASHRGSAY